MSDCEGEAKENVSPTASVPNSSSLTADEALARLEDHRCAICQKIIINACRIDCGHTYCRHCLNVDRENRNYNGTKRTCFICDAAVTEITHNAERDKEIDDLYATLPTNERLRRAREKFDRKVEEDNLSNRPKETNNAAQPQSEQANSNESFGSGDASYHTDNTTADLANACAWRNRNHSQYELPAFYGGAATFRIWQGENNFNFREGAGEESYDNNPEEETNSVNDGDLYNRPVIIHHTIQHVYHTVEVRNTTGESNGESINNSVTGQRLPMHSTDWSIHANSSQIPESFNDHSRFQRNLPSESRSDTYQRYRAYATSPSYERPCSAQVTPSTGFHHAHPYYAVPPYHPIPCTYLPSGSYMPPTYPNHNHPLERCLLSNNSNDFQTAPVHLNYNHTVGNMHATRFGDNSQPTFPYNNRSNIGSDRISSDEENGANFPHHESEGGGYFRCESEQGLCEYHRELRDQQRRSNESVRFSESLERTNSNEILSPCSPSNNAIHLFVREPLEELEDNAEEDDRSESDEEDHIITFRISVPIHEGYEEATERRNSSHEFVRSRLI